MAEIKDVKVWTSPDKKEYRIYVHSTDGREGCKYLTGNRWNPKGTVTGNLTSDEWKAARELAVWDKQWHTVYAEALPSRSRRCPDCGGYDCEHECNANRIIR